MDSKWSLFQKFLITEEVQVSIEDFLLGTLILIVLSIILEFTYMKCAKSISNRRVFAGNFLLIAFTTMLIISIVKSSLALSLGLVGALSIVRFRAAIKEPEELTYLFFAIALGLGLGANQQLVTITAFIIMSLIIWTRYFISPRQRSQNMLFSISGSPGENMNLSTVSEIFNKHFKKYELKRYDENPDQVEMSFLIDINDPSKLDACKKALLSVSPGLSVTYIDNKSY
jgi:hypothetical protein